MSNINEALDALMRIDGAVAVSIVDSTSGFMLGAQGRGLDLEYASAGNTELYNAQQKIMNTLGIKEKIEDFLITMETQYHILYPIPHIQGTFVYFILNKSGGTLALARRQIASAVAELKI